jgi:hypothetical protein
MFQILSTSKSSKTFSKKEKARPCSVALAKVAGLRLGKFSCTALELKQGPVGRFEENPGRWHSKNAVQRSVMSFAGRLQGADGLQPHGIGGNSGKYPRSEWAVVACAFEKAEG